MSYLGFIRPLLRGVIKRYQAPRILEIGLDLGQSSLPLIHNLCSNFNTFYYAGIDINLRPEMTNQILNLSNIVFRINGQVQFDDCPTKVVDLLEANSLDFLKQNLNKGDIKFDLILLDGDHNYYTVSNELAMLEHFCTDHTIIVCDDYNGRYATEDGFYSEYAGYEKNVMVTKKDFIRKNSKKKGVKTAIDDFVNSKASRSWSIYNSPYEPCILYQKNTCRIEGVALGDSGKTCDDILILLTDNEKISDFSS